MSKVLDRISFWSLFLVIVLLPLFFLPFSKIPVETSKGLLLVIGLSVSIIFWTAARFSDGKISLPRSGLVLAGLGVALVVLVSAFFSSVPQMSFFGTMFDIGTFWFIFSGILLMIMSAIMLREPANAQKVFLGLTGSFFLIFIFQVFHIFTPVSTSFGILTGKTSNLLGSWPAFGIFAGLIATMSLFALEFFSFPKFLRNVLKISTVLSLILAILVNSILVWEVLGIFALIIFIYKISFSFGRRNEEGAVADAPQAVMNFPIASLVIVMISLLFFMAGSHIGGYIPDKLGLANIEVGPSLGATTTVAKEVLIKHPITGLGPNRFADAWAMYRPQGINATQFWDVSFDSGSGILPTFAVTTGIIGILAWLAFFVLFFLAGLKSILRSIRNNLNLEMTACFVAALYLFVSAFFYSTGPVLYLLAFAFTGAFVGLSKVGKKNGEIYIVFFGNPQKSFLSVIVLVAIMIATAALGFKYTERFASVSYFGKALAAQNVTDAEISINKALSLYQNDLYLRTYAQVYLLKLNNLASKGANLSEAEKADLQVSFDKAVNGAQSAAVVNPNNYLNYRALGAVYETVGSYGVEGGYAKAVESYLTASELSPKNPGLKIALARVYLVQNKLREAKEYGNEALILKDNYVEALILLSQVAKSEGNVSGAISYAERALSFAPGNSDIIKYIESLKGTAPASTPTEN